MLVLLFSAGCKGSLYVVNENDPDKPRVVATPSDVENLIGDAYRTYWLATEQWYGPNGLSVAADELASSWGNTGMRDLSAIPRKAFDNTVSYIYIGHIEVPWFGLYSTMAMVSDGLRAILDEDDPVLIGHKGADNPRAIAFGKFVQGVSYGFLAAFFDQAYIVDETIDWEELAADPAIAPLVSYDEVMVAAIGYLQAAIDVAEAADPFTTPSEWINGYPMNNALLAQVAHSYIARYMAAVARTPAERAAVDWVAVREHATKGLTSSAADFGPWGDGYVDWYSDHRWIAANLIWTRADYHTIGLTDNSGQFDNWVTTVDGDRIQFVITTDDRRIHGAKPDTVITPADTSQGTPADTTITPAIETPGTQFAYIRSYCPPRRRGHHNSYYLHTAWKSYMETESEQMITLSYREMRLLIAEADYRLGNPGAAADIVNVTRTAAGLAALDGTEPDFFKWLTYVRRRSRLSSGAQDWPSSTGAVGPTAAASL